MSTPRLARWQNITLATLTIGYAGYYICRSNFSVVTPLLLEEFGAQGIDKAAIGKVASVGVLFYAAGKLINGVLSDFIGGRRMFLFGMVGSIGATVLFGFGAGLAVFMIAWSINRAVQSTGWSALVKVASGWFPIERHGTVMGILALSYLFGDVVARLYLGKLIDFGFGWRNVFFVSAATLAVITIGNFLLLKSSPKDIGEEEPDANPQNVFGEKGNEARPEGIYELILPFFSSGAFWLVCVMSFGLTVIRETFNFWTPTYLYEVSGVAEGKAASLSAFFPLFGGLSVLAAGFLSDRFTTGQRGSVMFFFLLPVVVVLLALGRLESASAVTSLVLISSVGFLMMGPYSFLTGVIALDLGGKRGSSTAAGLVDSVGYFGGIVSGWGIGTIAEKYGWNAAFGFLAGIAAVTTVAAGAYWILFRKTKPDLAER